MRYIFILFFGIIIASCSDKKDAKKSDFSIAEENVGLGDYYVKKNIADSAFFYYTKAEKIYTDLNAENKKGEVLYKKAHFYYWNGDFVRAKITSLKAISILGESHNTDDELYEAYNLLGIISDDLKEYNKSIKYHNKALEYSLNSALYKGLSLNNLGVVYQNINKDNEAVTYFKQALIDPYIYKNRPILYAMLLDNLAYSKLKLKEYSELPGLFYKALNIRDSLKVVPGIVINKLHLSEYYQNQKDNNKAIQYAREAYTIAKEKGVDVADVLRCLKRLTDIDEVNRSSYLTEYVNLSDIHKNSETKLANKISQAEFEKEELLLKNIKLAKELNNIITASFILFLILTCILVCCYLAYKNKKIKIKEDLLREKERADNVDKGFYNMLLFQSDKLNQENREVISKMHLRLLKKIEKLKYCTGDSYDEITDVQNELVKISEYVMKENESSFGIILQDLIAHYDDLDVRFSIPKYKWHEVDASIKVTLYKVIKEVFDNIVKHAKAEEVYAVISVENDILKLMISDDGIGFDTSKIEEKSALKFLRLSIKEMKGVFTVNSKKGSGTKINLEMKLL